MVRFVLSLLLVLVLQHGLGFSRGLTLKVAIKRDYLNKIREKLDQRACRLVPFNTSFILTSLIKYINNWSYKVIK